MRDRKKHLRWFVLLGCIAGCSASHENQAISIAAAKDFGLAFSPLYAAFDGEHDYRVPVTALGGVVVDAWEVVDRSGAPRHDAADIVPDASFGGVVLTAREAGDWVVIAHAGALYGCAELHVAAATAQDWSLGEESYRASHLLPDSRLETSPGLDLSAGVSCASCHCNSSSCLANELSPLQTAGFSDAEVVQDIATGARLVDTPAATDEGLCTALPRAPVSILGTPRAVISYFHSGLTAPDELAAIVLYMRSFALMSEGSADFDYSRLNDAADATP